MMQVLQGVCWEQVRRVKRRKRRKRRAIGKEVIVGVEVPVKVGVEVEVEVETGAEAEAEAEVATGTGVGAETEVEEVGVEAEAGIGEVEAVAITKAGIQGTAGPKTGDQKIRITIVVDDQAEATKIEEVGVGVEAEIVIMKIVQNIKIKVKQRIEQTIAPPHMMHQTKRMIIKTQWKAVSQQMIVKIMRAV